MPRLMTFPRLIVTKVMPVGMSPAAVPVAASALFAAASRVAGAAAPDMATAAL